MQANFAGDGDYDDDNVGDVGGNLMAIIMLTATVIVTAILMMVVPIVVDVDNGA